MRIPAEELIPHRAPMTMVDVLVESGGGAARGEVTFPEDHLGVSGGRVLESALVECVAQTTAAMKGLDAGAARFLNRPQAGGGDAGDAPGMLAGVAAFRIVRQPRAGELLEIRVREEKSLGPMSLVAGQVLAGGEVVAEGQLKLYG